MLRLRCKESIRPPRVVQAISSNKKSLVAPEEAFVELSVFKRDIGDPEKMDLEIVWEQDPRNNKWVQGVNYQEGKEGYFKRKHGQSVETNKTDTIHEGP